MKIILFLFCSCIGWKTQNKAVDKRTCRHLKEYLGEKTESDRCGIEMAAENKGGAATIFRAPKHKSVSVLLANKWTDRLVVIYMILFRNKISVREFKFSLVCIVVVSILKLTVICLHIKRCVAPFILFFFNLNKKL